MSVYQRLLFDSQLIPKSIACIKYPAELINGKSHDLPPLGHTFVVCGPQPIRDDVALPNMATGKKRKCNQEERAM